jgi:PTH1 family peptidyl-tRNA hydrolase
MQLFVGLGNPGAKYANHRHNVGYMAVDRIASDHDFAPWRAKFDGQISDGKLGGEKIMLLKPETFMNLSGESVGKAMRYFKLDSTDITVFQDEIDLAPGKIRVKNGGGHAGHNGLRSLHQHIGPHYCRVRIGVGHPGHKDRVSGYVLHDFAKADQNWLEDMLRGISDGAPDLANGDSGRFLNTVALRVKPPPRAKPAAPKPQAAKPSETTEPNNTRNPLQKLIDRFR